MVKVFTLNENGKIEFTKDELEKLLNEAWNDGYYHHGTYWWLSPSSVPTITTPYYTTDDKTISIICCARMDGDADE